MRNEIKLRVSITRYICTTLLSCIEKGFVYNEKKKLYKNNQESGSVCLSTMNFFNFEKHSMLKFNIGRVPRKRFYLFEPRTHSSFAFFRLHAPFFRPRTFVPPFRFISMTVRLNSNLCSLITSDVKAFRLCHFRIFCVSRQPFRCQFWH